MAYRDRLLTCPQCGKPLEHRGRRAAWPCKACGGVTIEIHELRRLLDRIRPDPAPHAHLVTPSRWPPVQRRRCAACGQPMRAVRLHGVELDRCDRDAMIWMMSADLDRVIDAAIAEHDARRGWLQRLRDLLFAN